MYLRSDGQLVPRVPIIHLASATPVKAPPKSYPHHETATQLLAALKHIALNRTQFGVDLLVGTGSTSYAPNRVDGSGDFLLQSPECPEGVQPAPIDELCVLQGAIGAYRAPQRLPIPDVKKAARVAAITAARTLSTAHTNEIDASLPQSHGNGVSQQLKSGLRIRFIVYYSS
jgi:hypothetical protein